MLVPAGDPRQYIFKELVVSTGSATAQSLQPTIPMPTQMQFGAPAAGTQMVPAQPMAVAQPGIQMATLTMPAAMNEPPPPYEVGLVAPDHGGQRMMPR